MRGLKGGVYIFLERWTHLTGCLAVVKLLGQQLDPLQHGGLQTQQPITFEYRRLARLITSAADCDAPFKLILSKIDLNG